MTREDYEQRKLRLQEHLRSGVELLEAVYRQQARALDLLWMAEAGEPAEIPVPRSTALAEAPSGPSRIKLRAGQLAEEIAAVLPGLPEVFDRNDLRRALPREPDRTSLFRALNGFVQEGRLAVEQYGRGQTPTTFRKLRNKND